MDRINEDYFQKVKQRRNIKKWFFVNEFLLLRVFGKLRIGGFLVIGVVLVVLVVIVLVVVMVVIVVCFALSGFQLRVVKLSGCQVIGLSN